MKTFTNALIAGAVLLTLACDGQLNAPTDITPSFSKNSNAKTSNSTFRFVDNDWGLDIVGEVQVEVRQLFMMNLVTGDSKGVVSNPAVLWESSDPTIATVSALRGRGFVRMVKPGHVTIRASLGAAEARASFHVFGAPDRFHVTSSNSRPPIGSTVVIRAQVADAIDQPLKKSGHMITWSRTNGGSFSSPTSTTDANGIATVNFTVGTNTSTPHVVTATDEKGITGNSAVAPRSGPAVRIEVTTPAARYPVGISVPVFVRAWDSYGNPATEATITWTWTGGLTLDTPNNELTDGSGNMLGVFKTPATPGSFRVTATSGGVSAQSPVFSTF